MILKLQPLRLASSDGTICPEAPAPPSIIPARSGTRSDGMAPARGSAAGGWETNRPLILPNPFLPHHGAGV